MKINKGDIFLLGKHRLMYGDSLKWTDVKKLLDGQTMNMVFTDPPYGIGYDRENHAWKHDYKTHMKRTLIGDEKGEFDIIKVLDLFNTGIIKGAFYVCCGTSQIGEIWNWCVKKLKQEPTMIIWYKSNMSISRRDYHRRFETVMYCWFPGKKFRGEKDGTNTDVWPIQNRIVSKYLHPTQKPIRLIQKAIVNSSDPGDNVMDLFGGSGSTLIACEQSKRRCFMMELDPHYVKIIIKRWESLTNEKIIKL